MQMLVADTGLSPARAYALTTKDRAEQLRKFLAPEFRRPSTYTGAISAGIGEFATYSICPFDDKQKCIHIAPTKENIEIIFAECWNNDTCTIEGILDIDQDFFAVITRAHLIERYKYDSDKEVYVNRHDDNDPKKKEEAKLHEKLAHLKKMSEDLMQ